MPVKKGTNAKKPAESAHLPRAEGSGAPDGPGARPAQPTRRSIRTHLSLTLGAIVIANALSFAQWGTQLLWPVTLPDHWVSSPNGRTDCNQLHATSPDSSAVETPAPVSHELTFCEDAEALRGKWEGWSLYSCDPNRGHWNTVMGPLNDPAPRGALWLWHHRSANATPQPLALTDFPIERTFHPLGISLHEETDTLFVVNHARERSAVEVFTLSQDDAASVRHLRTLEHPTALHTPNAVEALSATSFLVTNDHFVARRPPPVDEIALMLQHRLGSRPLANALAHVVAIPPLAGALAKVETLLGLTGGWVEEVEFAGGAVKTQQIASRVPFANGIALSPDGKTLAVAATTAPGVRLYPLGTHEPSQGFRLPVLGSLEGTDFETIPLRFTPDNIAFVPKPGGADTSHPFGGARLIVAGHPNPLKLVARAKDPYSGRIDPSPSWVVSIDALPPRSDAFEPPSASVGPETLPVRATRPKFDQAQDRKRTKTRFVVQTLYQSSGLRGSSGALASSSSSAVFDESTDSLIVAGLYSAGLMVCRPVELELAS
ncbi:unnamed protein product [Parajaminaea phylloscopi]